MLRTKLIPPGSFDQIVVIGYDRGSDTLFGKDFQKQAVRYSSIQDMHAGNAAADRRCAVVELGKHSTADHAAADQVFRIGCGQSGNKRALIVDILIKSFNIC